MNRCIDPQLLLWLSRFRSYDRYKYSILDIDDKYTDLVAERYHLIDDINILCNRYEDLYLENTELKSKVNILEEFLKENC